MEDWKWKFFGNISSCKTTSLLEVSFEFVSIILDTSFMSLLSSLGVLKLNLNSSPLLDADFLMKSDFLLGWASRTFIFAFPKKTI